MRVSDLGSIQEAERGHRRPQFPMAVNFSIRRNPRKKEKPEGMQEGAVAVPYCEV